MATNANPAPTPAPKTSEKLSGVITKINTLETKFQKELAVFMDSYRITAKAETVRLGIADRRQLTAFLMTCGDLNGSRVSKVAAFVFPACAENRKTLDKIMETNSKETNPNKRVSREVLEKIASAKEPMSIEQAKAAIAKPSERAPGGETNQTEKKSATKPKSIKARENDAVTTLIAILKELVEEEYDETDCRAVVERAFAESELFDEEEEEESEDEESDDDDDSAE